MTKKTIIAALLLLTSIALNAAIINPNASIVNPLNTQWFYDGDQIRVDADISANLGQCRVSFIVDGVEADHTTMNRPTYLFTVHFPWTATASTDPNQLLTVHVLQVKVVDSLGYSATSKAISVLVYH